MKFFFSKTIAVWRLSAETGNKETYALNGTIYGEILPVSAEDVMLSEGNPAMTYKLFCANDSDIKETDRVIYDSKTYIVKSLRTWSKKSINVKEATIELMNS